MPCPGPVCPGGASVSPRSGLQAEVFVRALLPGLSLLGLALFMGHDRARTPKFAGEPQDPAHAFATGRLPDASRGPDTRPGTPPSEALNAVVRQYCFVCHNDAMMTGNMTVQSFDVTAAWEDWETAERMIAKLRTGMMPPPGIPRPGGDTLLTLVETLEQTIDDYAAANPNPGNRSFQRLNRAEYEQAIQDLFGTWHLPSCD